MSARSPKTGMDCYRERGCRRERRPKNLPSNLVIRNASLMEIEFPIEFLVAGTPVSSQAGRPDTKTQWKDRVRAASVGALPQPHFASGERMAVTIYNFPDQPMQGDVDNIVKLILDALCRHVYLDDKQVERVVVQKFDPENAFVFSQSSEVLDSAVVRRPVVYIRVSNDPFEDLR
jgi:crossover junction endodeoxyribonuclease RusA